jgi:hypothetical protein
MEPAADRDLPEVQRLLAAAQGYVVFGRDRKRVGILIEVAADSNGGKIAVRRDGVFVWRRELLSLATVARVDNEEHTVLLNVESDALHDDPEPIAATPEPAPDRESDWRGRISRYPPSRATGWWRWTARRLRRARRSRSPRNLGRFA